LTNASDPEMRFEANSGSKTSVSPLKLEKEIIKTRRKKFILFRISIEFKFKKHIHYQYDLNLVIQLFYCKD
jgi:hypothetical protein